MTKGENRQVRNLWPWETSVHSGLLKIVFDVQVKNGCLIIINQFMTTSGYMYKQRTLHFTKKHMYIKLVF